MSDIQPVASSAAFVGGTVLAIFLATLVLAVVSVVAGVAFGAIQYYLGSMRIEAAVFIGSVFGGAAGVYAARYSCDALLKAYSPKAVFFWLIALSLLFIGVEIFMIGLTWNSPSRIAQFLAVATFAWIVFWNGDI